MSSERTRRLLAAGAATLEAAGVPSPRLDASILLATVLGVTRFDLLAGSAPQVGAHERRRYVALVRARARHEPVAYLVGTRDFFGRAFAVDRRVLVPRPETEVLAAHAIAWLSARPPARHNVLDLCTGSGCVAITIAAEVASAAVLGTDVSSGALAVAEANAARLLPGRVRFALGDLYDAASGGPFDLVVANPPYISTLEWGGVDRAAREFEPEVALKSGGDPVAFHRRILDGAQAVLARDGAIMLEVGSGAGDVVAMARARLPGARAHVVDDLEGRPRVVVVVSGSLP